MIRFTGRRWLFGVIAAAALSSGCESRDVAAPVPAVAPDIEETTSRGRAAYWSGGNEYAQRVIGDAKRGGRFGNAIENLEAAGYRSEPGLGFVIEGEGELGSASIACTMLPHPETERLGVVVRVVSERGGTRVASAVLERSANGAGLQLVELDGPRGVSAGTARADEEFWWDVLDCLAVAIPTTLVGCTISCAAIVVGYPQCVLTCAVAQSLTATVKCYVSALLRHGGGTREIEQG